LAGPDYGRSLVHVLLPGKENISLGKLLMMPYFLVTFSLGYDMLFYQIDSFSVFIDFIIKSVQHT